MFVFRSARKTRTLDRAVCTSLVELRFAVAERKSKISLPIRDRDGHPGFPIDLKNTHLVEGIESLLPVKFLQVLFRKRSRKCPSQFLLGGYLIRSTTTLLKTIVSDFFIRLMFQSNSYLNVLCPPQGRKA